MAGLKEHRDILVRSWFARSVFGVLSLCILFFGTMAILKSPLMSYTNYWGGLVFGPFAIVVGALLIMVAVIFPERLGRDRPRFKWRR